MTTTWRLGRTVDEGAAAPRVIRRTAVKAVVTSRGRLLLLSTTVGYKFPGGGVLAGEGHETALRRELDEECGLDLASMADRLLVVVECHPSVEEQGALFEMTSHYYSSTVHDRPCRTQRLDAYEAELGLTPEWADPLHAVRVNHAAVRQRPPKALPTWVARELAVLQYVLARRLAHRPASQAPAPEVSRPATAPATTPIATSPG